MRMLELPFCFNEYSTQVANSLSCKSAGHGVGGESMVACTYRTKVAGKPYLMTVTWCRSIGGAGLSLQVRDMSGEAEEGLDGGSSKEEEMGEEGDERRSEGGGETAAWVLGGRRKGSKELCWEGATAVWDMTEARYEGAEPKEGFYFAVVAHGKEVVLMLGDRTAEAEKRVAAEGGGAATVSWAAETTTSSLVWRREEVVGRRVFVLRGARLSSDAAARLHDIIIECNWRAAEPRLVVRIDRRTAFHVKKLRWKFRGNQTILVDGSPVELFWDVHDWLFAGDGGGGAAVFLFQSSPPLSSSSDRSFSSLASTSTSLFQWHHHSHHHHHHPSSSISSLKDFDHSGFSLLLYAWKT